MIGDLLFQEDRLTQKGKESLRKIQQLLTLKSPSGSGVQYIPRSRLNSGESDVTSASSSYIVNTPRRVSFVSYSDSVCFCGWKCEIVCNMSGLCDHLDCLKS